MKSKFAVRVFSCCFALLLMLATRPALGQSTAYRVTGLTSDRPGANHQSTTLLNPWGVAFLPGGNFFIAENASGRVDSYDADGNFVGGVAIPAPPGSTDAFSQPTGIVAIPQADFAPQSGNFQFLVAADNGTIWGFTTANGVPEVATKFVDNSGVARYTGLAVLRPDCCGAFLAVANFRQGTVDTFSRLGDPLSLSPLVANPFVDPNLPPGFSPFNIQVIGNQVFVTYAQREIGIVPVSAAGDGLVNVFDLTGNFVRRFVSPGDAVIAPWGITKASANFGPFSNDILIANGAGDGSVNAYDPTSGSFLGQLSDGGNPLSFAGMRGLAFRADGIGDPNTLYDVDGAAQGAAPSGVFGTITTGSASFIAVNQFISSGRGFFLPDDQITVMATIVTASGTPTGTVTFVDTCCSLNPTLVQTTLGTANVVDGVASITSTFASGDHEITVSYSGDTNFVPTHKSASFSVSFVTATQLVVPSSSTSGTPVVLRANITTTSAVQPTLIPGQVSFLDGSVSLGTASVNGGVAQLILNSLAPGVHTIVASYPIGSSGTTLFLASQSAPSTVTVENPAPDITSFAPVSAKQNSGAFTLTVNGSNFVNGAVVFFNGSARPTTFVSSTQITAAILASDLSSAGTPTLLVNNPPPGGGSSFRSLFAIDTATATSVALGSNAFTVTAGQSTTVNVQATGFTGAISATCLNAPDGVTCTFNPSNNTLTIQTAAITPKGFHVITFVVNAQALASNNSTPVLLATTFGVSVLPLGSVIMEIRRRRKLRKAYWMVLLLGLVLLLSMAVGCGGYGNSGGMQQPNPTPQTQSAQASAFLTLTVQ